MVDTFDIPKSLKGFELEWFILFGICVAGKSAKQTQDKLNRLLNDMGNKYEGPFQKVRSAIKAGELGKVLRKHKIGQYKRINTAFRQVVEPTLVDLDNLTIPMLEAVKGIGPKTARFIILYSDPAADCVPLDTHILKYLREKYWPFGQKVPKNTPAAGPTYNYWERQFQLTAAEQNKTVRQLDTEVWLSYAKQ